jgi:predicted amidophosphoribosyltransferase
VTDGLKKCGFGEQQKHKSKRERKAVSMLCEMDFSSKYVIFIDDIVTTGATALSARQAIGACKGFEVWCLAHRRQLATNMSF